MEELNVPKGENLKGFLHGLDEPDGSFPAPKTLFRRLSICRKAIST